MQVYIEYNNTDLYFFINDCCVWYLASPMKRWNNKYVTVKTIQEMTLTLYLVFKIVFTFHIIYGRNIFFYSSKISDLNIFNSPVKLNLF